MQEGVLIDIDNQIKTQGSKIRRKDLGEIEELQKKIVTLEQRDTSAQVRALYCGRPHRVLENPLPPYCRKPHRICEYPSPPLWYETPSNTPSTLFRGAHAATGG
jgi:hypothetical protein